MFAKLDSFLFLQMSEDPVTAATKVSTAAPVIACFDSSYYLFVENKVLLRGISTFCKALALWFALHYVFHLEYDKPVSEALFLQEFVFGLPAIRSKRGATYLTVSSDIQSSMFY